MQKKIYLCIIWSTAVVSVLYWYVDRSHNSFSVRGTTGGPPYRSNLRQNYFASWGGPYLAPRNTLNSSWITYLKHRTIGRFVENYFGVPHMLKVEVFWPTWTTKGPAAAAGAMSLISAMNVWTGACERPISWELPLPSHPPSQRSAKKKIKAVCVLSCSAILFLKCFWHMLWYCRLDDFVRWMTVLFKVHPTGGAAFKKMMAHEPKTGFGKNNLACLRTFLVVWLFLNIMPARAARLEVWGLKNGLSNWQSM